VYINLCFNLFRLKTQLRVALRAFLVEMTQKI
jgi:hypothetical protein